MSFQNCKIVAVNYDSEDYHKQEAQRGSDKFRLSSSSLREFAACPQRWIRGYTPPDSDAKDFGSLADCLVLTPGQFADRFVVQPDTYKNEKGEVKPWHWASNTCKAWMQENAGRHIATDSDVKEARCLARSILEDEILASFISLSEKQVLIRGEWLEDGVTIPVQCLIDLVPRKDTEFFQCAGDLKTTRNASPFVWQRWSSQRGYHLQGAFNLDMLNAATGEQRDSWCFVVVENFHPWQTARRLLSSEKLEIGRTKYQRRLRLYAHCLKTGEWPDYDNGDTVQGWTLDMPTKWDEMDDIHIPGMTLEEVHAQEQTADDDIIL